MEFIAKGWCACGCGQKTNLAPYSLKSKGWINGEPFKYIRGHNSRVDHPMYKTGIQQHGAGYLAIVDHKNPRSDTRGRVLVHRMIAETVLGKPLPQKAVVHHVNEDKTDNAKCNLVICEDTKYHRLLHQRKRALDACGNANHRKCHICKKYDNTMNLKKKKNEEVHYHVSCVTAYNLKRYYIRKLQRRMHNERNV